MTTKRQLDRELESFTIRIPGWLKESLEKVKGTIAGASTVSDAARLALERGVATFGPLADADELLSLQSDRQQGLQRIVSKWRHNQLLSRAELAFIGQLAHEAYMYASQTNIQKAAFLDNLEAFSKVRELRNKIYKENEEYKGLDRYYRSNLGSTGGDSLPEKISSTITSLKACPDAAYAEFVSRCLEVALRDEPLLPIDQLNDVLRPHLSGLIKLALRAYWLANDTSAMAVSQDLTIPYGDRSPQPVSEGNISVSPSLIGDGMTAAIIWRKGNVIITLSGFAEFNELVTLVSAMATQPMASGRRFHFFVAPGSPYFVRVGGVQVEFEGTEFQDLRTALGNLMNQDAMKAEYNRLSWIYGEI